MHLGQNGAGIGIRHRNGMPSFTKCLLDMKHALGRFKARNPFAAKEFMDRRVSGMQRIVEGQHRRRLGMCEVAWRS